MRYLLIIFLSLFFWSCSEGDNPLSSPQIQIPEISDICENILSDVDGSLVSCDESCGLFSENCYHLYDLQVLEDIVFMNDSLNLSLLDVGYQGWTDGRLTTLNLSNLELIALPESICNLNAITNVNNNQLCPPYQFECIDDIGTQNISGCADFTDYSGQSYYDFDINVLTEIKNLNPILSDILLLDIGYQQWYNGRLSSINLSNLELIALPESICNLNSVINVNNNQLCQGFQYECIDQDGWGTQSGLESMDDCGICGGNNEDIDVCGQCFRDVTDPNNCCQEQVISSTINFDNSEDFTLHYLDILDIGTGCHAMLSVTANGDYGDISEYADIYVETNYYGNVGNYGYNNSCDCQSNTESYEISSSDLMNYSQDGQLIVEVNNSSYVDSFCDDYYQYYDDCVNENSHTINLYVTYQDQCFNDADSDGICDDVDDCPNDPNNTDQDNDGLCNDIDLCPDDPLNECFPEEGFTYIIYYDLECSGSYPGSTLITFLPDGTWNMPYYNDTGTWNSNLGQVNFVQGYCDMSDSINVDLQMLFDSDYGNSYNWDLQEGMGTNGEGYHSSGYNQLNSLDGITTLTLYNPLLHGDINKIHKTSKFSVTGDIIDSEK